MIRLFAKKGSSNYCNTWFFLFFIEIEIRCLIENDKNKKEIKKFNVGSTVNTNTSLRENKK